MNLSKFELARVLGARSLQLANGAPPLIEVNDVVSPIELAKRELDAGVIPLAVLR
jgi:DNA-directed RNA polymerase subunit K/omega